MHVDTVNVEIEHLLKVNNIKEIPVTSLSQALQCKCYCDVTEVFVKTK